MTTLTFKTQVHFRSARHGRKQMTVGPTPVAAPPPPLGRVPRISRLMALAIRFDGLLQRGEVKNLAEIARLGHITRARATQIMNLLNLAPDIQEAILCLPPTKSGRDPIRELRVRPIAATPNWQAQRRMWTTTRAEAKHECEIM